MNQIESSSNYPIRQAPTTGHDLDLSPPLGELERPVTVDAILREKALRAAASVEENLKEEASATAVQAERDEISETEEIGARVTKILKKRSR